MKQNTFLFALSIPLIFVAYILFALFIIVAYPAVLIGRKQAFDLMYHLKEIL